MCLIVAQMLTMSAQIYYIILIMLLGVLTSFFLFFFHLFVYIFVIASLTNESTFVLPMFYEMGPKYILQFSCYIVII